eukprot:TRINITY_DN17883_c0_g1_i2.p1 TRINITY_DN17883_c0_g1~~TRINITY_DN17883_c0_g1_i2.p1  ORF type:complete len:391 (+),score=89.98 TRINITY_DN17883_c0_g1_i2:111-1283(+)
MGEFYRRRGSAIHGQKEFDFGRRKSQEELPAFIKPVKDLEASLELDDEFDDDLAITDEELRRCWSEYTTHLVHGRITFGQSVSSEKERAWLTCDASGKFPGQFPPIISCLKGARSSLEDDFAIAYLQNGWKLACCVDGHGSNGHLVSNRAANVLPYFVAIEMMETDLADEDEEKSIEEVLVNAFERTHKDLLAFSSKHIWDIKASGAAVAAVLYRGDMIYTAHCGDSRCAIGYETTGVMIHATEDHKPNVVREQVRIAAAGGEVCSQTYRDGWTVHRVYAVGQDYPALCKSRSLGDYALKACGVIPTPEVSKIQVELSERPFIMLCSDGVWEFLDSEFVIKAVAKKLPADGPQRTMEKLQREAKKRWKQEEDDYCDDVTSILILLRDEGN